MSDWNRHAMPARLTDRRDYGPEGRLVKIEVTTIRSLGWRAVSSTVPYALASSFGKACAHSRTLRESRNGERGLAMMMVGIVVAVITIVTALYGFGFFDTPYIGTFRVAFYFFLLFLVVTLVGGVATQSH